jgi:hypothetical protein
MLTAAVIVLAIDRRIALVLFALLMLSAAGAIVVGWLSLLPPERERAVCGSGRGASQKATRPDCHFPARESFARRAAAASRVQRDSAVVLFGDDHSAGLGRSRAADRLCMVWIDFRAGHWVFDHPIEPHTSAADCWRRAHAGAVAWRAVVVGSNCGGATIAGAVGIRRKKEQRRPDSSG